MADIFNLTAEMRNDFGKNAARRLRHQEDKVPAVIYGAGKATKSIVMSHKELSHALDQEAVYSHILTISLEGKNEKVVLKDIHRHPSKPRVLHVDFLRIKAKEKLTMSIPIHFLGEEEAPGVEAGGVISHNMNEIEIRCLPADLPERIELDVSGVELDQSLHISDLKLPQGVELTIQELDEEHNQAVFGIHTPRVEEEEEVTAEAEEGEEAAAEGEEAASEEKAEEGEKTASKEEKAKE